MTAFSSLILSRGVPLHHTIKLSPRSGVLESKMATEEGKLMTPEDLAEQAQWDEEFKRRQEDMARRELQSRERRRQVSTKMQELDQRWRMMEQRRVLRSREANNHSSQGL